MHVWGQKDQKRHLNHSKSKRSKWGGKVKGLVADHDKNQVLAERSEALLATLKLRCPGLPQTALDMSKIQYNKDVGQAILESYSRVIESLGYNIMARIDDLLFVDSARCIHGMHCSVLCTRQINILLLLSFSTGLEQNRDFS